MQLSATTPSTGWARLRRKGALSSTSGLTKVTPTQSILRWTRRLVIGWGVVEGSTLGAAALSIAAGLPAVVVVFNTQLVNLIAGLVVLVRMIRQGRSERKRNGHETHTNRTGDRREGGSQCAL